MALTKDDIRLAAERLHQAENTRKQSAPGSDEPDCGILLRREESLE
jgi:2-keto-4-pentenoate hydratase